MTSLCMNGTLNRLFWEKPNLTNRNVRTIWIFNTGYKKVLLDSELKKKKAIRGGNVFSVQGGGYEGIYCHPQLLSISPTAIYAPQTQMGLLT